MSTTSNHHQSRDGAPKPHVHKHKSGCGPLLLLLVLIGGGYAVWEYADENKYTAKLKLICQNLCQGKGINSTEFGKRLRAAAQSGDLETVKLLLAGEVAVDTTAEDQRTALHQAAAEGQTEVVKLLLEHGAKVDVADKQGMTPLHCAVQGGRAEVVSLLLSAGADPEARGEAGGRVTPLSLARVTKHSECEALLAAKIRERTALELSAKGIEPAAYTENLVEACESDELSGLMRQLVKAGADVNAAISAGRTPLIAAAESGNYTALHELLEHRADVKRADETGRTPLHAAAQSGSTKAVETLLDHGAEIAAADKAGRTPLMQAVMSSKTEAAKLLLERGARADAQDVDGCTVLHLAAEKGAGASVPLLLERGADVNARDGKGRTPLAVAVAGGASQIADVLIRKGADVNAADAEGKTPLDVARNDDCIVLLAKAGARDGSGAVALHRALDAKDAALTSKLLEAKVDVDVCDERQRTPLDRALSDPASVELCVLLDKAGARTGSGDPALLAALRSGNAALFNKLLQGGASVNAASRDGTSVLVYAVYAGDVDAVRSLLEAGARTGQSAGADGSTPLHTAARRANADVINLLIEAGAPVNAADANGATPLHVAVQRRNDEALVALLRKGASVSSVTKQGDTALHLAADTAFNDAISLLLEAGADAEQRNAAGLTPLECAMNCNNAKGAELLRKHVQKSSVSQDMAELNALIDDLRTRSYNDPVLRLYQRRLLGILPRIAAGESVNTVIANANGTTALHNACGLGHYEIVRWLVEHGADCSLRTAKGATMIDCIGEDPQRRIYKLIKAHL